VIFRLFIFPYSNLAYNWPEYLSFKIPIFKKMASEVANMFVNGDKKYHHDRDGTE
jgi:hypothetical protein